MTFRPAEDRAISHLEIYRSEVGWRSIADESGIAIFYRIAAAEFRALGMVAAAERCDEKAERMSVK